VRRVDLSVWLSQGTLGVMVALILGMLICLGLALAVVALVAIPARREGRELLTPQGEELVATVKDKTESTIERTGERISDAKDKVTDSLGTSTLRDKVDDTQSRKAS
jgi:hypothetical protein